MQIESRHDIEVESLSEDLWARAWKLFSEREDKAWSLTDCTSFVTMQDRGLADALSTDAHFEQAGFRALLRLTPT